MGIYTKKQCPSLGGALLECELDFGFAFHFADVHLFLSIAQECPVVGTTVGQAVAERETERHAQIAGKISAAVVLDIPECFEAFHQFLMAVVMIEEQNKLIAALTGDNAALSAERADDLGNLLEVHIALIVAVLVIDALETIRIDHHKSTMAE